MRTQKLTKLKVRRKKRRRRLQRKRRKRRRAKKNLNLMQKNPPLLKLRQLYLNLLIK